MAKQGSGKEAVDKATGDARAGGKADRAEGKVQKAIGGIKGAVRDAVEGAKQRVPANFALAAKVPSACVT